MKRTRQHSFSVQFVCSFTVICTQEMRESTAVKKTTLNLRLYARNYETSGNGQVVEYSKGPSLVKGKFCMKTIRYSLAPPLGKNSHFVFPLLYSTHTFLL